MVFPTHSVPSSFWTRHRKQLYLVNLSTPVLNTVMIVLFVACVNKPDVCVCVFRMTLWQSWRSWNRKSWTKIFWKSKEQKTSLYPAYRLHHCHLDQVWSHTQIEQTLFKNTIHILLRVNIKCNVLFLFVLAKKKVEEDEDDMADLEKWAANWASCQPSCLSLCCYTGSRHLEERRRPWAAGTLLFLKAFIPTSNHSPNL